LALLVGGSAGVGDLFAAAEDIAASTLAVPVVLCGTNDGLRRRLGRAGLGAVGWVDNMPALLGCADVIVQNAGGLTCLEALATGVPVITYRALPGHGRENARVLDEAGLAAWPRTEAALNACLGSILGAKPERYVPPGAALTALVRAMIANVAVRA